MPTSWPRCAALEAFQWLVYSKIIEFFCKKTCRVFSRPCFSLVTAPCWEPTHTAVSSMFEKQLKSTLVSSFWTNCMRMSLDWCESIFLQAMSLMFISSIVAGAQLTVLRNKLRFLGFSWWWTFPSLSLYIYICVFLKEGLCVFWGIFCGPSEDILKHCPEVSDLLEILECKVDPHSEIPCSIRICHLRCLPRVESPATLLVFKFSLYMQSSVHVYI